jgi:predicted transcriptional regulator
MRRPLNRRVAPPRIAQATGLSRGTVYRYESGMVREPSHSSFSRIQEIYIQRCEPPKR